MRMAFPREVYCASDCGSASDGCLFKLGALSRDDGVVWSINEVLMLAIPEKACMAFVTSRVKRSFLLALVV